MKDGIGKIFLYLFFIVSLSCVPDVSQNNQGTGHDGETKVLGVVHNSNGTPVTGLNVRMLPSSFNPVNDNFGDLGYIDITDSKGEYEFKIDDSLINGYYTISAYHELSKSFLYLDSIALIDTLINEGIDTLIGSKTITIVNESTDSVSESIIVFITGTDLIIDTINSGVNTISIPLDTVNLVIQDQDDKLGSTNKKILPDDTTGIVINPDTTSENLYINFSGDTTVLLNDTALFSFVSNLDSLYPIIRNVTFSPKVKGPNDSSFTYTPDVEKPNFVKTFSDTGFWQMFLVGKFERYDSTGSFIDTFSIQSDTIDIVCLGDIQLSSNVKLFALDSVLNVGDYTYFSLIYTDSSGDTIYDTTNHMKFNFGDSTITNWLPFKDSISHIWSQTGQYLVIGSILIDSLYQYSDTVSISIIDTLGIDTLYIDTPRTPTGSSHHYYNENRTYVTDNDYLIYNNDTLFYEYQFSPDMSDTGNSTNWDTLPYTEFSWNVKGIKFVTVRKRLKKYPNKISEWAEPLYVKIFADSTDSLISLDDFEVPYTPTGDSVLLAGQTGTFLTGAGSCIVPGVLEYRFDWGDGTFSNWGDEKYAQKTWSSKGYYYVKAQARCSTDFSIVSQKTEGLFVAVE